MGLELLFKGVHGVHCQHFLNQVPAGKVLIFCAESSESESITVKWQQLNNDLNICIKSMFSFCGAVGN